MKEESLELHSQIVPKSQRVADFEYTKNNLRHFSNVSTDHPPSKQAISFQDKSFKTRFPYSARTFPLCSYSTIYLPI